MVVASYAHHINVAPQSPRPSLSLKSFSHHCCHQLPLPLLSLSHHIIVDCTMQGCTCQSFNPHFQQQGRRWQSRHPYRHCNNPPLSRVSSTPIFTDLDNRNALQAGPPNTFVVAVIQHCFNYCCIAVIAPVVDVQMRPWLYH